MGKHTRMQQLPSSEQPYELCWERGPEALTDAQLISAILRTGSRDESALDLSRRILSFPGTGGLTGLYHMSLQELVQIRGIGRVKAVQLKCITEVSRRIARSQRTGRTQFSCPGSVADYYMEDFRHEEKEKVLLCLLSANSTLIGEELISIGSMTEALVSPREVFRCALRYNAASVVLLHNHPSGDPTPSRADLELTERMSRSGDLIGIKLLDHIILGDHTYSSFQEMNLLT